jgi:hypothetical protein
MKIKHSKELALRRRKRIRYKIIGVAEQPTPGRALFAKTHLCAGH